MLPTPLEHRDITYYTVSLKSDFLVLIVQGKFIFNDHYPPYGTFGCVKLIY